MLEQAVLVDDEVSGCVRGIVRVRYEEATNGLLLYGRAMILCR